MVFIQWKNYQKTKFWFGHEDYKIKVRYMWRNKEIYKKIEIKEMGLGNWNGKIPYSCLIFVNSESDIFLFWITKNKTGEYTELSIELNSRYRIVGYSISIWWIFFRYFTPINWILPETCKILE